MPTFETKQWFCTHKTPLWLNYGYTSQVFLKKKWVNVQTLKNEIIRNKHTSLYNLFIDFDKKKW